MHKLLVFLLITLLITLSQSLAGFGVVGSFITSAFRCLLAAKPGYSPYVLVRVYQNTHSPAGLDPNGLSTMINAFQAGFAANPDV
jgi:hypothetical protein